MRSHWPFLAILCLLASLLVPGTASASTAAGAETRVGASDFTDGVGVGVERPVALELHRGCAGTYDDLASDSLLAARGGETAARGASTAFGRSVQSLKETLGSGKGPWGRISAHAEEASGRAYRGGTSIEEVFRNAETGERIIRHTITRGGEILYETFRTYSKFGG
ncbi:MAG: hypothetical protein AB1486_16235 [Planctomycetota bacterium]